MTIPDVPRNVGDAGRLVHGAAPVEQTGVGDRQDEQAKDHVYVNGITDAQMTEDLFS